MRGLILYLAFAAGGLWYGARGLVSGAQKLAAGGYAGHARDLTIDVLTVLIQLGLGMVLAVRFILAVRHTANAPDKRAE